MKKIALLLTILISQCMVAQNQNLSNPDDYTNSSLMPEVGQYLINGWVKEAVSSQQISYNESRISVYLYNDTGVLVDQYHFSPSGKIIDQWQKIEGIIMVQSHHKYISIELENLSNNKQVFFDDIRMFPVSGNMKSFVYDQETLKLMAELDENNYATFYEYDQEGGLIRVKKETEKGVFTIQETRSSNVKQ
ncbi:MAG: hypothetical protein J0L86_05030 [Flavobacteriales bacterium]|nr:hypothetical protein [Flavobacteriales bacterium]